ncbi:Protein C31H1.5, partial [Aphelenchoides avenae]
NAPPIEAFDYDIPFPGSSGPRHCGAGRLSNFLTRLVAVPCEVEQMDACCLEHDICYANADRSQAYCDAKFCSCLHAIKTNFYCSGFTQYGMCIIARGFGHHFYTAREALLARSDDAERLSAAAKVVSAVIQPNVSHKTTS